MLAVLLMASTADGFGPVRSDSVGFIPLESKKTGFVNWPTTDRNNVHRKQIEKECQVLPRRQSLFQKR